MTKYLDQLDEVSASLTRNYHQHGKFALVVRTFGKNDIRIIGPQVGAPVLAELFQRCATLVFDGPAAVTIKRD